ncbi:MAG: dihydropteroate synthase [Verrucomicrobia bacterium]|nr:dihydropteroate synthase [Verrucomicrobiota bacterium]
MIWKIRDREIDLSRRARVMGIINATPDSFSDGGSFLDPQAALAHGLQMVAEGAEILDIGGESTRPGAQSVEADEEIRRVLPIIQALRRESPVLLSIDTSKAAVAQAALDAGADIINDVTGLRGDSEMPALAASSKAGIVIMHMQGEPRTMQLAPTYDDVVEEVGNFFRQAVARSVACGIDPMRIALDPGIGFGKTPEHNRRLLAELSAFLEFGRPLLVGASRKSFLGWLAGSSAMDDRFWPGVALTSLCRERGARILRVHDVKPHTEALRMTEAILGDV